MASARIEFEGSKLAAALVKFQADLPDIGLDSENPHFKSKFASLPKITKIVLPKLAEHGLTFTSGGTVLDGQFGLSATLLHESGEERSGFFPIIATDPQKIGSAFTYARRYLLSSLTGIVADADDDGNGASLPTQGEKQAIAANDRVVKAAQSVSGRGGAATNGGVQTTKDKLRVNYIETGKVTSDELNDRVAAYQKQGKNQAQAMEAVLKDLEAE